MPATAEQVFPETFIGFNSKILSILSPLNTDLSDIYVFTRRFQDNAASHNGYYVEEDITEMFDDGTFSQNVANGTFKDIFPGMYITKTYTASGYESSITEDFVVGDLDYHLHHGTTETTDHHALMVMKNGSTVTHKMNDTNTTANGFVGSKMWTTIIPAYATAIQNAFGSSHILSHSELLTAGMNSSAVSMAGAGLTGGANSWAWQDVLFNIMNSAMRFGVTPSSSSDFDTSDCTNQLALFRLSNSLKIARNGKGGEVSIDWMRDVCNSQGFVICGSAGYTDSHTASIAHIIRGYFLLI